MDNSLKIKKTNIENRDKQTIWIRRKIIFLCLILFPFLVATIAFFIVREPTIDLINDENFIISEFTDKSDNGNSISKLTRMNGMVKWNFALKQGFDFPYTGIEINKSDHSLFSLEKYKIRLKLKTNEELRLSIRTSQFIDNYTSPEESSSFLVVLKSFGLTKGVNDITIRSSDINEIPEWWFSKNPKRQNNVGKYESLDKTSSIWLLTESVVTKNKDLSIDIEKMEFIYDASPFFHLMLILFPIYYLTLLFLFLKFSFLKKKSHEEQTNTSPQYIIVPMEKTESNNNATENQIPILEYIGKNYPRPELKLSDVASHLCISEAKTSDLLKMSVNMSFRQYLNNLRMEEAKRLLKETDLQISEIAFKVGYNNIQHFNRVFKEYTELAPRSFREKGTNLKH